MKTCINRLATTLVTLLPLGAIAASAPSVEDRLKQLEKQMEVMVKENTTLKKELGYDPKKPLAFVRAAGKESKMTVGGFIQAQAEFGDAADPRFAGIEDRFLLRRARLNVAGSFAEHIDFKLEADFGNASISERVGYSAQMTDGYINWSKYEWANVKIGQFKSPFGYEQLFSDTKVLTIERSLPTDRLTDNRQVGLGFSGEFANKRAGYSVGMFNGTFSNNGFNDNREFMYAGRVTGSPFKGKIGKLDAELSLGLNALISDDNGVSKPGFKLDSIPGGAVDNLFVGNRASYGADVQGKLGPVQVQAEFINTHFRPTTDIPADRFDAQGWYALVAYDIIPKKLQALAKFESLDGNTARRGDSSDVWTVGLTYFLRGDDLKFMLNYLYGDPSGVPGGRQGRLMGRVQVMF